jgi:hypothetical protein
MQNDNLKNENPTDANNVLGEVKHYLEYCMYSTKVSWCPICKKHFYNERNKEHTTNATKEHYHVL